MSNTLITPTNVARAALATYQYSAVLPRLCNRNYVTEFGGGSGDTVTIRKQASLTTTKFNRATGVVVQDVVEGSEQLTVGDIYDASVVINQEQWDLDLESFSFQIAQPMGKAMSRTSEEVVYAAMLAGSSAPATPAGASAINTAVALRTQLTASEVPADNRVMVIGSDVTAQLLLDDHLLKTNEAGNSDALRNANVGRLFGMPVVESVVVGAGEMWIIQREALTFVSITPSMPRGAERAAVEVYDNQAFRVVFGYNQDKKQDLISGDSYLTSKVTRPEGVVGATLTPATP